MYPHFSPGFHPEHETRPEPRLAEDEDDTEAADDFLGDVALPIVAAVGLLAIALVVAIVAFAVMEVAA